MENSQSKPKLRSGIIEPAIGMIHLNGRVASLLELGTRDQLFICEIPNLPLLPGEYKIHVGLDIALSEGDCVEDATRLAVIESAFYGTSIFPTKGGFLLDNRWTLGPDGKEVAA